MLICGGFAPSFPFPKTTETDFGKMPAKDAGARQNIMRAAAQRKLLGEALKRGEPEKVAQAADEYLPLVIGMWRAMEQVRILSGCLTA